MESPRKLVSKLKRHIWIFRVALGVVATFGWIGTLLLMDRHRKDPIERYWQKPLEVQVVMSYRLDPSMTEGVLYLNDYKVTFYTNRVEETDSTPNHSATGELVYEGLVAVSQDMFRKAIRPGDLVYIAKIKKWFRCGDTMNPRHTKHIDVFFYRSKLKEKEESDLWKNQFSSDVYVVRLKQDYPEKRK